jgi:hypothetical protein
MALEKLSSHVLNFHQIASIEEEEGEGSLGCLKQVNCTLIMTTYITFGSHSRANFIL